MLTIGVGAAVGVICLAAAAFLYGPAGRYQPRLAVALLLTGVVGILGTPLGGWLNKAANWASGLASSVTGRLVGTAVGGLVAAVALAFLVLDVKANRITRRTLATGVLVPVAAATIPGPVGHAVTVALAAVTGLVAWVIGAAFGIS
jgi:hypothetical protein